MPNHVRNALTVFGDAETVTAFAEQVSDTFPIAGPNSDGVDFFPLKYGPQQRKSISFHAIVPLPASYSVLPYDPHGIDLERALWGVKWGPYDIGTAKHEAGMSTYDFNTAWSCARRWLCAASAAWPTLTFACSYGGEGPTSGRSCWRAGAPLVDFDDSNVPCGLPDLPDEPSNEEEDAWYVQYRDFECRHVTTHAAWVAELRGVS